MRIASQGWFTGTVTAISSDGTHLTADTAPTGGNGKDATATTAGIVLVVTGVTPDTALAASAVRATNPQRRHPGRPENGHPPPRRVRGR